MQTMWIEKGTRITARWMQANPMTCLAGAQPKVGATEHVVSGIVRHVRADSPDALMPTALFIDPEPGYVGSTMRPPRCTCPAEHVLVKPDWIVSVG